MAASLPFTQLGVSMAAIRRLVGRRLQLLQLHHNGAPQGGRFYFRSSDHHGDRDQSLEDRYYTEPPRIPQMGKGREVDCQMEGIMKYAQSDLRFQVLNCRSQNLLRNNCGICAVYLIGCEHWSQESSILTRGVLRKYRPEAVMVELCQQRLELLFGEEPNEMQAAFEESRNYGASFILGDELDEITDQKIEALPDSERDSYDSYGLVEEEKSGLTLEGQIRLLEEKSPNITDIIIHQRNRVMVEIMKRDIIPFHSSMAAVVGAYHVFGIKKLLLGGEEGDEDSSS